MRIDRDGDVVVITMEQGEQALNDRTVTALNEALDEAEGTSGPAALVLAGVGKTFHQGLDLEYVGGLGEGFAPFILTVHALFGRLLRSELPTVAAINGHAIAGGAMLAQCTDVRIMRADRGWFRLPEVELRMPFTAVMNGLLDARLPQPVKHRMMVLGERLGGAEAAAAGVVDDAVEGEEATVEAAAAAAAALAQHRGPVLATIRRTLYRPLLERIARDGDVEDLFAP